MINVQNKRGAKLNGKLLAYSHSNSIPNKGLSFSHYQDGDILVGNCNVICSNYKCGQSKRINHRDVRLTMKLPKVNRCPKCQSKMISIGNKVRIPKIGSVQRKRIIELATSHSRSQRAVSPNHKVMSTRLSNKSN